MSYRREVRGEVTTFGTSGMLFNSALVMYDRATESLWTHFDGRAVVGTLTGEELVPIGSPLLAWGDFKATYPEARCWTGAAPATAGRTGPTPMRATTILTASRSSSAGSADDRARVMQRVVGITVGEESLAYSLDGLVD